MSQPAHHQNPFKDRHPSQSAASNFDGGPLYGVHERDNWLISRDEGGDADDDEVHRSKPNLNWARMLPKKLPTNQLL